VETSTIQVSGWRPLVQGLVVAGCLLGPAPPAALALDDATCRAYAKEAVRQFERRSLRQCFGNVGNPQWWSPDEDYHYRWCRGISDPGLLTKGHKDRDDIIESCKPLMTEVTCAAYARDAAQQNRDRLARGCTSNIGRSDMWNSDENYHLRWCRGVSDPGLLEAGTKARANVLATCGIEDPGPDFECDAFIGTVQPPRVRKYFNEPRRESKSDAGSAVCIYDFGNGEEIRAEGNWKAKFVPWPVVVQVQVGCDSTSRGIGTVRTTPIGIHANSPTAHSSASVSGNSPRTIKLAQDAHGMLNDMFIIAELQARPCR
jgi:hypothetical protein